MLGIAKLRPCSSAQILHVTASDHVRVLGVTFSSDFSLEKHVFKTCAVSTASIGFVNFVVSGRHLMDGSAATLVYAFVTSRVEYCNAVYALQGGRRRLPTSCNECSMPPLWSVTHGSLISAWRHSSTMSFIGWMCQRGFLQTRWVSRCTAVFTVRHHLGTSPTTSLQPDVTSRVRLRLQTDTSSSYLAVDSTHMAVGRFRSLVRRSGTRCLTSSEIRRVVLTVL